MALVTMPTEPGFSSFSLIPESISALSESPFTFKRQAISYDGERWRFRGTTPNIPKSQYKKWLSFFAKLKSQKNTFLLTIPDGDVDGAWTGTPLVAGAGQTGNSLNIDGANTNVTGWALEGDFFQLGSGSSSRLYMVTEDANSDGSGNVTLNIWPSLITAPSDNAPLVSSGAQGVFRMDDRSTPIDVNNNSFGSLSFSASSEV